MKSILDPTFVYTKSIETDISKTFARVRASMQAQKPACAHTGFPGGRCEKCGEVIQKPSSN